MNNKDKFDRYFDELYRPLCAFAYRFVKDPEVVEDLVQEVFINLWENTEPRNESSVRSYLYTATRNACLNHLKHDAVVKKHESQIKYELESDQQFNHQIIEEEVFNRLYTEIRELPNAAQKIMLLALKGLKNNEIAEQLKISENTVKTQKKIAYAKLKRNISVPVLLNVLNF